MKQLAILIASSLVLFGCASTAVNEEQRVSLEFSGDMLFEGSNTLQVPASLSPASIAAELGVPPAALKRVSVTEVLLQMKHDDAAITESLLMQMVSNNESLKTIGTLSPLTDPGALKLNLAEKSDILPFLRDQGATWVLDLNISEDYPDALDLKASVSLRVEYND